MSLTILIASYLEPELVARIEAVAPGLTVINRPDLIGSPRFVADHTAPITRTPQQEAEWQTLLAQADVLFDFDQTHTTDLPDVASRLRWIQGTSAGIGKFVEHMRYANRTSWIFTTASGVHARPLAEFALMGMLMFAKNYEYLQSEKAAHHWERYCGNDLSGKTAAIIGLGKIGREVARLAQAFDMRVIGTRRDPSRLTPHVDQLYPPAPLEPLLCTTDYLILATPHTRETEGLIGAAELAALPRGAVLINLARGAVVNQPALTAALRSGHLRGAVLDVFAVEPLPTDDPLWDMPNVIISPHSASTVTTENAKIVDIFCENIRRFLAKEPMLNVLDVEKGY